MVILKTLMLTSSLFGLASGSVSEAPLPNMDVCKHYIQKQINESYDSQKFNVKLSNEDAYMNATYKNWPFEVVITHECVDLSEKK